VVALLVLLAPFAWVAVSRSATDLTAMLPADDPVLAREARLFDGQGSARVMAVELHGPEDATRTVAADLLTLVAPLGAHPPTTATPAGLARAAGVALDHLDVLLTADDLAALAPRITPAALTASLQHLKQRALRADDALTASTAAGDPLGLAAIPLSDLRRGPGASHPDGATFVAGEYRLLPLAVEFAPNDIDRAGRLIDALMARAAAPELAQQGVTLAITGAYRHYVENARTVARDLGATGPLGLLLIALSMWSLLGRVRTLFVVHVPALLGMLGALAGAGVWSLITGHPLPLPMLGFAAGLLGIAVDYGTHQATAAANGHAPQRELVLSFVTTAAAFTVLLSSGTPAIQCLGALVVSGLATALIATLWLLPGLLPTAMPGDRWGRVSGPVLAWSERHPGRRLGLAAVITLGCLPGLLHLHFETDLRRYDGSSRAAWAALDGVLTRWGPPDTSSFLVGEGRDPATALATAETARQHLGLPPSALARPLATPDEQRRRRAAWNDFWQQHADFPALFTAACHDAGLRPAGFAPALTRYAPVPADAPLLAADAWRETPLQTAIELQITGRDDAWIAATPLIGVGQRDAAALSGRLAGDATAWVANRGDLGQRVVDALRHDLLQRTVLIAGVIAAVVFLGARAWRRGIATLLPPFLALAWTFGILGWAGTAVSPFTLLAAAFLLGIGIDSAIFLAGRQGPASLSPVLNAALTTIVGMGALCLADHPVVRGIGICLTLGMSATLVAALLITPALTPGQNEHA
jgi:predicted exporter